MSRGARRLASFLIVCVAIAGCSGEEQSAVDTPLAEGEARAQQEIDPQVIEALRALPYAGSTDVAAGDGVGVVWRDAERVCRGRRLVTYQKLSRADLIDDEGTLLQTWTHTPSYLWERAELTEDGGLLVIGVDPHEWHDEQTHFRIADEARYVLRFAPDGETILWKTYTPAHHDIEVRPDGNLAALTFRRRRVPLFHPDVDVRDDRITTLDADSGKVVDTTGLLSMALGAGKDFPLVPIAPDELGGDPWIDLFHTNSIEWMRESPLFATHDLYAAHHVLLCFRHQNRIAIVDSAKKSFLWTWGVGELGGPHDAQLLPGGTILLFDNGLGRNWSRALEVDPRTNEIVWEWHAQPPEDFYTPTKGSAQRLPNGNTLMAESDAGRALEVTSDGDVVWEWMSPHETAPGKRATLVRMRWVGAD